MPTSQKVQIDTFDFGSSLTVPTLGALATGTTIANGTASTCNEQTADSGVYIADFVGADASALIPAGTYRLRTTVNGLPLKRFVTFTGIDGELVYARSEEHAVLDTAARVKLAADQPDYAPATASALSDLQTDVDANTGYLTSLTSSMTTLLGRVTSNVYTMWTDLIAMITGSGSNPKYTTTALSNAPTGSGGSGGGNAPTIVTLQAVAGISPGVIVGPSEPLVIGDDYLTTLGRSIRVNLLDENGDPAEVEFGDYALDDEGISIQLLLAKSGKPTTVADLVGTCTFSPATEVDGVVIPPYLIVEFTRTETAKAIPGAYDMQAEAVWEDGKVVTFAPYGQLSFVRNIRRS